MWINLILICMCNNFIILNLMFVKNDSFWLYVEYGGKIVIGVGDFE